MRAHAGRLLPVGRSFELGYSSSWLCDSQEGQQIGGPATYSLAPRAGLVASRQTFVRRRHGVPWLRNDTIN
jgi:hypothetical protein